MSRVWPIVVFILAAYACAAILVPCDGDCTPAEEVASHVW
jgi:hypothetical protein